MWFSFPLHVVDDTGLLADCKPNFGGISEARRMRQEAENQGKISSLDAACERLMAAAGGGSFPRDELERELEITTNTVNKWLDKSKRFMRVNPGDGTRARVIRREGAGGDA